MKNETITAIGTPNIALVKYWGKRDIKLNLPTNSSISITLDESLNTKTSVLFSDKLNEDKLYINKELYDLKDRKNEKTAFMADIIEYMRKLKKISSKMLIVSENSFPTASGLASSASGAATLCYSISKALDLNLSEKELSIIARRISGSACRSIAGGFVMWKKGEMANGSDSYAEQIVNEKHWPEVIDIITLVSGEKKKISSSEGHKLTPTTSELYKNRPSSAEARAEKLKKAISEKNFQELAEITMRDSNSLHAVMLDTYPPIIYLNDISKKIIYAIHELNESNGSLVAAYTFDAGPNAQIITLEKNKNKVVAAIKGIVDDNKIIIARQGKGPRLLKEEDSLIDENKLVPR